MGFDVPMPALLRARIAQMAHHAGFTRARRSFRKPVGDGGGLILHWEDRVARISTTGYRECDLYLSICPAWLARVQGQLDDEVGVTFMDRPAPCSCCIALLRPVSDGSHGMGVYGHFYEANDAGALATFAEGLESWFNYAAPLGESWAQNPMVVMDGTLKPPQGLLTGAVPTSVRPSLPPVASTVAAVLVGDDDRARYELSRVEEIVERLPVPMWSESLRVLHHAFPQLAET